LIEQTNEAEDKIQILIRLGRFSLEVKTFEETLEILNFKGEQRGVLLNCLKIHNLEAKVLKDKKTSARVKFETTSKMSLEGRGLNVKIAFKGH